MGSKLHHHMSVDALKNAIECYTHQHAICSTICHQEVTEAGRTVLGAADVDFPRDNVRAYTC